MSMSTRLGHVCNTLLGLYQNDYSDIYDNFLNDILDNADVVNFSEHRISFNLRGALYDVWIANKFYAYGSLRDGPTGEHHLRPKYKTMMRLYELERRLMP